MFVSLKMLLRTLLLPPAGPLLLAFVGAWLIGRHAAARRLGFGLLGVALGSLWLLSTPAIADRLGHAAEREPVLDITRLPDAQAIVILGGTGERHAAPEYAGLPAAGSDLLERLAYGAYLAHRTDLPVLVSGGFSETQAMRTSLARDFGVTVRWVESESRDTFENAQFSARLLRADGVRRILLVTHAAHEYRAMREFEACGLSVVAAPTGVWAPAVPSPMRYVPNVSALTRSTEALYELIGEGARRALAALHLRRHAAGT
jgi:uncharacterized SAM-binding protein YcdF (DUF218 family)